MSSMPVTKREDDNAETTIAVKCTNRKEPSVVAAAAAAAAAAATTTATTTTKTESLFPEEGGKSNIPDAPAAATTGIQQGGDFLSKEEEHNKNAECCGRQTRKCRNEENGMEGRRNAEQNPKDADDVDLLEGQDNKPSATTTTTTTTPIDVKTTKIMGATEWDGEKKKRAGEKHVMDSNGNVPAARDGNGNGNGNGDHGDKDACDDDGDNKDGGGDEDWDEAPHPPDLVQNDHHLQRPGAYRVTPGGPGLGAAVRAGEYGDDDGGELLVAPGREQEGNGGEQDGAGQRNTGNDDLEAFKVEGALVREPKKKHVTTEAQPIPQERRRKLWLSALLIFTLVVAVVLGVTLAVTMTKDHNSSSNSNNNAQQDQGGIVQNTSKPIELQAISQALIDEFRSSLSNETAASLLNTSSPQYKAMEWMTSASNQLKVNAAWNPVAQLTQRFALATLYFATGGTNQQQQGNSTSKNNGKKQPAWLNATNWLSYSHHECEWFGCNCSNNVSSPDDDRIGGGGAAVVQSLVLDHSQLVKNLPPEIGLLTNLEYLSLRGNALTGSIPTAVGRLTNLGTLDVSLNHLGGTIPTHVSLLSNLDFLYATLNLLSGTLPTDLGRLTHLKELDLSQNYLEGTLPVEIGRMTSLTFLNLAGQQLGNNQTHKINGTIAIPGLWNNLTNLEILGLNSNELTGSLPSTLGLLTSLWLLQLFDNPLTGSIPSELGKLTKLEYAPLFETNLTGTVPKEICGLIQDGLELEIDCVDITCTCAGCVCNENKTMDDDYYY